MTKVIVYAVRHGEKEDGKKLGFSNDLTALTPTGIQQVTDSAKKNLFGIIPDALFCSKKYRAAQTVLVICGVLPNRNNGCSVIAHEGFDYSSAPNLNLYADYTTEASKRVEAGAKKTVGLWIEIAPKMINHLREKITRTLLETATQVANNDDKDEYVVILGSHSPTAEMACINPDEMPMLKEADMVKYTIEVNGNDAQITTSEFLSRGF